MIGGLLIAAGCVLAPDAAGFESEIWAGSLPASDLNGNVVAQTGERTAYIPVSGSVDRAVMRTLCEAYGFYYRRWWPGRGGDSDTND